MRSRESRSVLLLWTLASAHAQTGSITLIESDKAFEHEVMGGDACWAILFISNNTQEPSEHTQMRFELASATLAERIQLGIVAVHEAPEAAAEFVTIGTPQIVLFTHRERFGKQLGLDPATLGAGQLTQAILSGIQANPTQAAGDRPSACQKAELTPHAAKEEL